MIRSNETERESRILRRFVYFEAMKQSVITYFTMVCALRSNETERESRILRGFERFEEAQGGDALRSGAQWRLMCP